MAGITDAFLVYSFMKRLVLPFNKWPAYKAGVIDEHGNVLKTRKSLTQQELRSWGRYDIMVANLKKLIAKIPGGSSMIGSTAAAAFLFKECMDLKADDDLILESRFNKYFEQILLSEDVAVNNASSGNVAALDNNPPTKKATLPMLRRIIKKEGRK